MKNLLRSIHRKNRDIIAHISTIHSDFEQIHPFSDGNGRIGRLLIHAMLLQSHLPPAVIIQEKKRLYMSHLNTSQRNGDTTLLQDFLCDAVLLGFDIIEKR
jgi:Fic family protein